MWAVAVSPDSQLIATASNDGTIRIWSVRSQRDVRVVHCAEASRRRSAREEHDDDDDVEEEEEEEEEGTRPYYS